MTLQQIIYVLTVAECGSMNKASDKLFVVQPTLTSAIRELENEMGITIFVRTRKGVTPTAEGAELLNDLKSLHQSYNTVMQKYQGEDSYKRKFGVSTQHYSFAVKAFVEMARNYDMNQFEFAIRETRTKQIILDVGSLRSEIGVLYVSELNRKALTRLFAEQELEFHSLVKCRAYVYLWEEHPLAREEFINIEQLEPYPCLSFEQDEEGSYFSEEILSENVYPKIIRATDRATMLNLMVGLLGYTLCSGIISSDLNGNGFVAVPFQEDEENLNSIMEIGYLTKKNSMLTKTAQQFIQQLRRVLEEAGTADSEEIY